MQADKDRWAHIKDPKERRRVQNVLAQQRYRRRKADEALRAAVASEYTQGPSLGHSSSLTMDGLEDPRSQEGSVISAASTKEGPADLVASAWSEREIAQLLNLPELPTLASQSCYPIACSSLNRSVTTSQHYPTGHAQLAPGTLLPLEDQYLIYQAPPPGTQAGAGRVSNFAGQFPGNVDFEYYPWFPQGSR